MTTFAAAMARSLGSKYTKNAFAAWAWSQTHFLFRAHAGNLSGSCSFSLGKLTEGLLRGGGERRKRKLGRAKGKEEKGRKKHPSPPK